MISSTSYKLLADKLGLAKSEASKITDNIISIKQTLNNNEVSNRDKQKEGLFGIIDVTYNLAFADNIEDSPLLLDVVKKLQEHITARYDSVNSFLAVNGIKVSQAFADLSSVAGFVISDEHIV